jgi:ribosomal protein L37AE/L43A
VFVVDIACPECERTTPVQKVALGEYRCVECDVAFSPRDLR